MFLWHKSHFLPHVWWKIIMLDHFLDPILKGETELFWYHDIIFFNGKWFAKTEEKSIRTSVRLESKKRTKIRSLGLLENMSLNPSRRGFWSGFSLVDRFSYVIYFSRFLLSATGILKMKLHTITHWAVTLQSMFERYDSLPY